MAEFLRLKKSNCKNCSKCIRHCPVKSIRFSGNQAHIIGNECILCGQCFVVCPQNAKEIADGIETAKVLIDSGAPVYASIAPSFIANYDNVGIDNLRDALVQLGFVGAEETAVGATIVKKEYERILSEGTRDVVISSCCHSINLLIQKYYPHLLPYLADVKSPMQVHAEWIKEVSPDAKVVFIGPCVAKKDEAERYGAVDAVLTFEELANWIKAENIVIKPGKDTTKESLARFFPTTGGILKTMTERNPRYQYHAIDGVENCIAALEDIAKGKIHNCFIEMSACAGSCVGGPVMEKYHNSPVRNLLDVFDYAGDEDFPVEHPEGLLLSKEFEMIDKKISRPSEREIMDTLRKMGKIKPEDELNCGSCGYKTCREKAVAIIQGKADVSTCLPYLREKAESLSDNIMTNSPNGIILLNENLEIQKINNVALSIVNMRNAADLMGEPVVRILDPSDFLRVMTSGKEIKEQKVYLAEYNKYVEQSISYDKNYHTLLCILRDITDVEIAREHRENINRQTIETADKVVEKQMRIVQEIASLLGETAAETKIALTKLKESIDE
ncbi:MAG: 4Fe-4S binding protein [Clostridia bacterium]|nr:4Fe-4S binding protein [Clostridia bacterium]